jgi:hypothetical protein
MKRLLLLSALLPVCASANLTLFVAPPNTAEIPVELTYQFGNAYVGDTTSIRFRIRNTGTASVALQTLRVSGTGFSMTGSPPLPHIVAPGSNVDFTVHFSPPDYGGYSANLQVNSLGVILRAGASPGLTLKLDGQIVSRDSTIDFGRIEKRQRKNLRIEAVNTTAEAVGFRSIVISGGPFKWASIGPPYLYLQPGEQMGFEIVFEPPTSGVHVGEIVIDRERKIKLTGTGTEPPLPRPTVVIETPAVRSGGQGAVTIRLPEPSRGKWKGTLKLAVQPAPGVMDNDSAAQFMSGGRTVDFTVWENEAKARFGAGDDVMHFQVGTTAATLTITAEVAGYTVESSVPVAAEPVRMERATASRGASTVDVQITGFDNTRTISDLHFTFYDTKGAALGPPVKADAAAAFANWWPASTLGGVFTLRAVFPVAGDVSNIGGVEVHAVNAAGSAKTDRLTF